MIFSDLFQSAYNSKDPQKRLSSIDKLDPSKEKDKTALHELAFNDENDDVSIKALERLDSFVLWMKASDTLQAPKIRKYALQTCISQLEMEHKVPHDLFVSFVSESKNKPLLEKLLFSSARLQSNAELSLNVLQMLANENHTRRYFQECASSEQQLRLIESENDAKTLNRWSKLTQNDDAKKLIESKLEAIELSKQKPIKVKQKATLINARLLALKESTDYEILQEQFSELVNEFEAVKQDFTCLDEISAAVFSEKYLFLKTSLQQKLSDLEAGYQQQLLLKHTTDLLSELGERCREVEQQINLLVAHSQSSEQSDQELSVSSQVKILGNSLDSILSELKTIDDSNISASHKKAGDSLLNNVNLLQNKLDNIPKIISIASELNTLIERQNVFVDSITNVAQQDDANQTHQLEVIEQQLASNKHAFIELKREYGNLMPVSLVKEFESSTNKLNKIKNTIKQEQKQKERKVESKLKVINTLISQGKYRPAISMFHNLENLYAKLAETASIRLQKSYQSTHDEISKLRDWQAYIAQPRKPQLIEQAQTLVNTTSTDLYQRADQIKSLRQEYSSLGNLHTSEDEELNQKFNEYIEQAFSPCREFFADLEKQREDNYNKALLLIEQVENAQTHVPQSELVKLANQFKTQFHQLGEIDKKHKNRIKRDFNKALKPINKAINDAVTENARLKQNLVKQVELICAELEDESFNLQEAVEQAKEIQNKWKQIGFAGKPKDNELWQGFRALNDQLFSRYHDSLSTKQNQINEQLDSISKLIKSYMQKIKEADNLSSLSFYDASRNELTEKIEQLDDKSSKLALKLISSMDEAYNQATNKINQQKEQQEMEDLFSFLDRYQTEVDSDHKSLEPLSSKYKSWVASYSNADKVLMGLDRLQLAQAATILFDKQFNELPIGDEISRKDIQLKIMASKLEGEGTILPESILAAWVSLGPLKEQDKTSFEVMKALYLKQ